MLANTRALSLSEAAERNRGIVEALAAAMAAEGLCPDQVQLVSRGDSTLRGHGVLEPQVLAEAWQERFEPVDATLHVPAFLPGGAPPWMGCISCMGTLFTPLRLPKTGCLATAPVILRPGWRRKAVAR